MSKNLAVKQLHLAIDGNEANVSNRVGSNVYAFKIIEELAKLINQDETLEATVLLAQPPIADFPKASQSWHYQIIQPLKFWTQFGEPLHLFKNKDKYDVLFTPGHYAPRLCPIPYVSSVMDLGYLYFPDQFRTNDFLQLKNWTQFSVRSAKKIIAISEFTKQEIINSYHRSANDVIVAYPAVSLNRQPASPNKEKAFFNQHQIRNNYFLFIGTLQPRKNLINLVKGYEIFCKENKFNQSRPQPQLVIGGKIGWLTEDLLDYIEASPVKDNIVLTGYVPAEIKPNLYQQALATVLVGTYEGFGIPPLESMNLGTIPIVSDSSSLPEVVGEAGLQVNPHKPEIIAEALFEVWQMPTKERDRYKLLMKKQVKKFSWQRSAQTILATLKQVALKN